jgi:hypothetical protein
MLKDGYINRAITVTNMTGCRIFLGVISSSAVRAIANSNGPSDLQRASTSIKYRVWVA